MSLAMNDVGMCSPKKSQKGLNEMNRYMDGVMNAEMPKMMKGSKRKKRI
jgi:hypothetical protein